MHNYQSTLVTSGQRQDNPVTAHSCVPSISTHSTNKIFEFRRQFAHEGVRIDNTARSSKKRQKTPNLALGTLMDAR